MNTRTITAAACAAALAMINLPALGAGGGGGGGGGGSGGGGGGSDMSAQQLDPDYQAGVAAVKSKDWPQVIEHMGAAIQRDPKNANAWNYRGYAFRQVGDMDASFKHYERALQLNPRHRGAHEYLGEAYLQVGKLALAEAQLKALDKLCWLPCEEYKDLKAKVADYKREHPTDAAAL